MSPNIYSVDEPVFARVSWVDLEDAREFAAGDPPVMRTVGYVLYYDPEPEGWITMTDTIGGDECSSVHKIPSCMIRSLEMLPCDKLS